MIISYEFLFSSHRIRRHLAVVVLTRAFTAVWILRSRLSGLIQRRVQMADVAAVVHKCLTYLRKSLVVSRRQYLRIAKWILIRCIRLWVISIWCCWHASSRFLVMPVIHHHLSGLAIATFIYFSLHSLKWVLTMLAQTDCVFAYAGISHESSILAVPEISECVCIFTLAHGCSSLLIQLIVGRQSMIHHFFPIRIVLLLISWNQLIWILSGIYAKGSAVIHYILIKSCREHLLVCPRIGQELSLHTISLVSRFTPHITISSFLGMHNRRIVNPLPWFQLILVDVDPHESVARPAGFVDTLRSLSRLIGQKGVHIVATIWCLLFLAKS